MSSMVGILFPPPIIPNGLAPAAALFAPGIPHGLALLAVLFEVLEVDDGKALLQAFVEAEEGVVVVDAAVAAEVVGFFLLPMTKKSVDPEAVTP